MPKDSDNNSILRQMPGDWVFHFSFIIVLCGSSLLAGLILYLLSGAKQGDWTLLYVAAGFAVLGCGLLFYARLPLYREGRYFVFGPKLLPARRRQIYWLAYTFIGMTIVLLVLLIVFLRG